MSLERDTVVAALRAEDVAAHLGITGRWFGRWMRSGRCGEADHGGESFGLARDGHWHCWACDKGGDLLKLLALSAKLDLRTDFPAVLALAAAIAGVEDDESFGLAAKPAPKVREPIPPVIPLAERIAIAKRRAAWAWTRLISQDEANITNGRTIAELYLQDRGIDPHAAYAVDQFRQTPLRCTMEEMAGKPELKSLAYLFASPGIAYGVRHVADGHLVDIRIRRFEPRADQPKIIGMLGGVTSAPAEGGRPRQAVGCYGSCHDIDSDLVVLTEGLMDYATACVVWPKDHVVGAVSAGELGLVAQIVARQLAERGRGSRLLIVEQADAPGVHRDGSTRLGAADAGVNEDPNSAAKVAGRIIGPARVGWLLCSTLSPGCKDLNDLVRFRGTEWPLQLEQWL